MNLYLLASNNKGGIDAVDDFVERGSGWYLADYVIRSYEPSTMGLDQILVMALRFLSATKQHCEGVSGMSQFVVIDRGGLSTTTITYDFNVAEQYIHQYEQACAQLLLSIGNPAIQEESVKDAIERFTKEALESHKAVKANSEAYRDFISRLSSLTEQPN
jgi:hypothetical protein